LLPAGEFPAVPVVQSPESGRFGSTFPVISITELISRQTRMIFDEFLTFRYFYQDKRGKEGLKI
jgi:hypothetical protein